MKKFIKPRIAIQTILACLVATFATAGIVAATTIGTNVDTGGTLTVSGTGATTLGGALTIAGDTTIDTNLLFVDISTDKIGIGTSSDLTVLLAVGSTTPTTVSGYRDAFFAGAVEIDGAIQADGALTVVGATILSNDLTINTNNFVVDITGNITMVPTSGIVAITGSTTISADLNVNSNDLFVDADGDIAIAPASGILAITGSTTISADLDISGLTTLANASSTLATFGNGTTVTGLSFGTCSVDPQSIAIGTSSPVSTSCHAVGVASGDTVFVTPPSDTTSDDNWLIFEGASASTTADYIEITLFNASTTAAINSSARTWSWMAIK